jgi:hypothetical protein
MEHDIGNILNYLTSIATKCVLFGETQNIHTTVYFPSFKFGSIDALLLSLNQ